MAENGIIINEREDEHGGTIIEITGTIVNLQDKTVTPTFSKQVIRPDNGNTGLSSVTVNKIPSAPGIVLSGTPRITGTISKKRFSLTGILSKSATADYYRGEYVITPSTNEQTLPTANKLLSRDVLVEEIPYYETTNERGGYTVIIG